jgi:hypothetical protein
VSVTYDRLVVFSVQKIITVFFAVLYVQNYQQKTPKKNNLGFDTIFTPLYVENHQSHSHSVIGHIVCLHGGFFVSLFFIWIYLKFCSLDVKQQSINQSIKLHSLKSSVSVTYDRLVVFSVQKIITVFFAVLFVQEIFTMVVCFL